MEVVLVLMLPRCAMPSVSPCHASTKYSKLCPTLRCHLRSHGTSSVSTWFLVSASLRTSHNHTSDVTPLLTLFESKACNQHLTNAQAKDIGYVRCDDCDKWVHTTRLRSHRELHTCVVAVYPHGRSPP